MATYAKINLFSSSPGLSSDKSSKAKAVALKGLRDIHSWLFLPRSNLFIIATIFFFKMNGTDTIAITIQNP
jgi:hypothetical protein